MYIVLSLFAERAQLFMKNWKNFVGSFCQDSKHVSFHNKNDILWMNSDWNEANYSSNN